MKTAVILLLQFATVPVISGMTGSSKGTSLTENANAVISEYHITYEVKSATDIRKTTIYKATVLNQNGRNYGRVRTITDNRSRLISFSGSISDSAGILLSRIKLSDLTDVPSYPDYVFAADDRLNYYEPVIQEYPYTLEYKEVKNYSGLISFETWMPVNNMNLSCDTASYTIIYPKNYKIRHSSFNIEGKPITARISDDLSSITWSINDFKAVELINYIPPAETFLPCLMVMPEKFSYDGHSGEVTDARTYGSWVASLLEGRDVLKPEIISRISRLTSTASTTREKVKRVYRYLQENTRYVAIAYGIGGFQPTPADEVSQYGYGDCKGLSNYMRSLLASIGIKSYYTEIGNGSRKITLDDFVFLQTNHAILCVPDGKDTIWLECTSQHYDAGYLGYSNSNRKAMLVTEDGGKIVNTPTADSTNNYRRAKYDMTISPDGSTSYRITADVTGHYYEDLLYLTRSTRDEAIRFLYSEIPFKNHSIASYQVSADTTRPAALRAVTDGHLNKYGTIAGKRLIVPAIPCKMFASVPKLEADREVAIHIGKHTACTDTIAIRIPEGYITAKVNETREFSNEIGRYRQSISTDGNNLLVVRDVVIPAHTWSAEHKNKVTEFFRKSHDIEAMSVMCELVQ